MASIELIANTPDDPEFVAWLVNHNIQKELVTKDTTIESDGWPVLKRTGTHCHLEEMIDVFWDDPDLYQVIK